MKFISKAITTASVISLILVATNVTAKGKYSSLVSSELDKIEGSHLTFMREEEKLARDVYLAFADM